MTSSTETVNSATAGSDFIWAYRTAAGIVGFCFAAGAVILGMLVVAGVTGNDFDSYSTFGLVSIFALAVPMYFVAGKPIVRDQQRRTAACCRVCSGCDCGCGGG